MKICKLDDLCIELIMTSAGASFLAAYTFLTIRYGWFRWIQVDCINQLSSNILNAANTCGGSINFGVMIQLSSMMVFSVGVGIAMSIYFIRKFKSRKIYCRCLKVSITYLYLMVGISLFIIFGFCLGVIMPTSTFTIIILLNKGIWIVFAMHSIYSIGLLLLYSQRLIYWK